MMKDRGQMITIITCPLLLFFNYMDFQIIKVYGINEIVLVEPGLVMPSEFLDCCVEPYRLAQVKFIADGIQSVEYLMCTGIITVIADDRVPEHLVIFEFFSP